MSKHFSFVALVVGMLVLFSCTTGEPRIFKVNGHTEVHTDKRFLGIPVSTDVRSIKTPEQAKADLEVKALADQQRTEAKRASIALWLGALLLLTATICAVVGYLTHGWKRWGGLAALCAMLAGLCWGFVEWIVYLKWGALALPIVALGLFLYDNKDKGNRVD
jgi:hypothetical protein